MWSNLRPLARLVVLALLTKVDAATCIIRAEFTPSLVTLHAMTGAAKSQIVKELDYLDRLGWVKRSRPERPSRIARTSYALTVGEMDPDRPTGPPHGPVNGPPDSDYAPPADMETDESEPVRSTDGTEPADGGTGPQHGPVDADAHETTDQESAGHQRSAPRTGPQHGPASTNYNNQSQNLETSSSEADHDDDPSPREDVEQLCRHLVDKIVANGSKRPTITKAWRVEARRLIDLDKRPVDKALALIDWCQNDVFWRSVVRSMPKFRAQYDQLRLRAVAEWEATKSTRSRGQPRYAGPYSDDAPDRDYEKGSL